MTFLPDPVPLLLLALTGLALAGALAPFEAMGWYAGWFGDERETLTPRPRANAPTRARGHLVFLSGIHSVARRSYAPSERRFLERLQQRLPDWEVLEVFPYSVSNRALTGQRAFSRLWRLAMQMKLHRRGTASALGMVINLRNAWQVAVSADHRYGPMYDEGSAELLDHALLARGYRGGPVVLVGYSGGGQIALGASTPLAERLDRKVTVVSLGGVMASPRDVTGLARLAHLVGDRDGVERIGTLFFPGRWPLLRWSLWNRSLRRGRIVVRGMGPIRHTGPGGYLDDGSQLPDGRSCQDATLDAIVAEAQQAAAAPPGAMQLN